MYVNLLWVLRNEHFQIFIDIKMYDVLFSLARMRLFYETALQTWIIHRQSGAPPVTTFKC